MCANENNDIEFHLVNDYKDSQMYRDSFNQLATLVFDIDFEDFYQKGLWDDRYICHSFISDHVVIANVSVSKMDLTINGKNKKAIQIGTVMTHPDFRGRGLSGKLMRHVLDLYEQDCEIFFLFANRTVTDFYPKFGFEPIVESQFKLHYQSTPTAVSTVRKLNGSNNEDLEFMKRMVLSRRPISDQFGVSNNQGIFMFYAIKVFPESIYYSHEDEAIIVYQQEGDTLHLYDVVSPSHVDLNSLLHRIATEQTEYIQFHFTPDQFIENVQCERMDSHGDTLFIKANFALDQHSTFCVPVLAHA